MTRASQHVPDVYEAALAVVNDNMQTMASVVDANHVESDLRCGSTPMEKVHIAQVRHCGVGRARAAVRSRVVRNMHGLAACALSGSGRSGGTLTDERRSGANTAARHDILTARMQGRARIRVVITAGEYLVRDHSDQT